MDGLNDDYDTPWKLAVTRYFPDFIAFYFPQAHAAIDWARPYVFLAEELAQLTTTRHSASACSTSWCRCMRWTAARNGC